MFGHQDDHQHDDKAAFPVDDAQNNGTAHQQNDAGVNPALPSDTATFGAPPNSDADTEATQDETPAPMDEVSPGTDADGFDSPVDETPSTDAAPVSNDLLDIKQQALQQLSPLVGHLDQSPEEKFRTTMMMIQASDDQNLVKTAYEAAKEITDEKAKAQALLDIVNEINYFTHQGSGEAN